MISKLLMGLLLAVLAYMVIMLMTCDSSNDSDSSNESESDETTSSTSENKESFSTITSFMSKLKSSETKKPLKSWNTNKPIRSWNNPGNVITEERIVVRQPFSNNINYEDFENAPGQVDQVSGAEPSAFKGADEMEESQYAKVNYTGLVDANPEDVLQIEGTDLLTAPLVDNMLYTNSIANTNRNASQDIRGDIPLQFNESYTPFYSSVIYGAPLSERTMTIGSLPASGPVGPVGPFSRGITATA